MPDAMILPFVDILTGQQYNKHEEVKVIKSKDGKVLWVMSTLSIEMPKLFLLQLVELGWK